MATRRGTRPGDLARWQQQQLREAERAKRAAETAAKAAERDERAKAIADGKREAEDRTATLQQRVERLGRLLVAGLDRPAAIDLERMLRTPRDVPFDPGALG